MQENHYPGKILWLRKHFAFPALSFKSFETSRIVSDCYVFSNRMGLLLKKQNQKSQFYGASGRIFVFFRVYRAAIITYMTNPEYFDWTGA